MAAFSVNDILKDPMQSAPKAEQRMKISYIAAADIVQNEHNDIYSMDDISLLKTSIEQIGLQQPIVVKPQDGGQYCIISGHRRFKAVSELGWEKVPCVLETDKTDLESQLSHVLANATARDMSDYDKLMQYKRVREILGAMKKETGAAGKVRDMVQQTLNMSTGQAARYDLILKYADKWSVDCLQKGTSSISSVYANAVRKKEYAQQEKLRAAEQAAKAKAEAERDAQLKSDGKLPLTEKDIETILLFQLQDNKASFKRQFEEDGMASLAKYIRDKENSKGTNCMPSGFRGWYDGSNKGADLRMDGYAEISIPWAKVAKILVQAWNWKEKPKPIDWTQAGHIVLKNDDARKEFLDGFENWPLLVEVPELGIICRRYELPDGTAFVHTKFEESNCGFVPHRIALMQKGKKYTGESTSTTELVEKLKSFKEV